MAKIIYTKYANERDRKFAIRTDILKHSDGRRSLKKSACYPEGRNHIEHIYQMGKNLEEVLKGADIAVNRCSKREFELELEYIEGKTLQEILDEYLSDNQKEKFNVRFENYLNKVYKTAKIPFEMSEEFQKVFGTITFEREQWSAVYTDIDMILSNIVVDENDTQTIIDYEWTFDFPIPIRFVVYRIIHYYEMGSAKRNQIRNENWYQRMDITSDEIKQFERMEKRFQKYVLDSHIPMRHMLANISPGIVNISYLLENNCSLNTEKLQVFHSSDGIIREEESEFFGISEGVTDKRIDLRPSDRILRLDPGENGGIVYIKQILWDTGERCKYTTNGMSMGKDSYLYTDPDPQIIVSQIPENAKRLYVIFEKITLDTKVLKKIEANFEEKYQEVVLGLEHDSEQLNRKLQELQVKVQMQSEEIERMKNTKVWRMYQKYKEIRRGE